MVASVTERGLVQVAGQEITYKVVGEETGGAFALLECTLGPGLLGAPPHMHHREDEVTCVLEGELMIQVGERVIYATPGCTIFKPRGVFHAFWNAGSTTARFLEFISPAGFEEYFHGLASLQPAEGPPDIPGILEHARQYDVEFRMDRLPEILQTYEVAMAPS
jgi:mannose-6-phosphate isomerase-like protein (cupin superfamily)